MGFCHFAGEITVNRFKIPIVIPNGLLIYFLNMNLTDFIRPADRSLKFLGQRYKCRLMYIY